jgi:hypothetical protein
MFRTTFRQTRELYHRADLDGANTSPWDLSGDGNGFVKIPCVDEEVAAELFAGLREWAICHELFSVAHPEAGRCRSWVQRSGAHILAVRVDLVGELFSGRDSAFASCDSVILVTFSLLQTTSDVAVNGRV